MSSELQRPQPNDCLESREILVSGNPNCGKTTLFNALTGLHYKVANYPGVTVEKKSGALSLDGWGRTPISDLPGIYCLSHASLDEKIASDALLEAADQNSQFLVVSVIDASNLERNLYLCSQLIDLGLPMLVALNMVDVAEKNGITIRDEILANALGVPVVRTVARHGDGTGQLKIELASALNSPKPPQNAFAWLPQDSAIREQATKLGSLQQAEASEQRQLLQGLLLLSDSISIKDKALRDAVNEARSQLSAKGIDCSSFEATLRYSWINEIVRRCTVVQDPNRRRLSERIDSVLTHRVWGSIFFLAMMAFIFQALFWWASAPMDLIDGAVSSIGDLVGATLPEGMLKSLLVDGVIAGVGSVLVFIPQIAILFFFLGLLEDSGYLARAAFLMDRIMRQVGLQGRSFIPLLSSFACAIPGILSTRTIPSFADRIVTTLIAPLMSCSARLPVYTLLIAAFIPERKISGFLSLQGLVLLAMYLLGVVAAGVMAWIFKRTLLRGEPAIFVMEMPPFRLPSIILAAREAWDRIVIFLKSAGTVILSCSVLLWFLASYPSGPVENSLAGRLGKTIEPVIQPLGFNWEVGVGIIASFAAREVFVTSLSTVYNLQNTDDDAHSITSELKRRHEAGSFTLASALSLMVFYVFACQCMSTLAVCRRETGTWFWPSLMFAYMTALAYAASFLTYRIMLG